MSSSLRWFSAIRTRSATANRQVSKSVIMSHLAGPQGRGERPGYRGQARPEPRPDIPVRWVEYVRQDRGLRGSGDIPPVGHRWDACAFPAGRRLLPCSRARDLGFVHVDPSIDFAHGHGIGMRQMHQRPPLRDRQTKLCPVTVGKPPARRGPQRRPADRAKGPQDQNPTCRRFPFAWKITVWTSLGAQSLTPPQRQPRQQ